VEFGHGTASLRKKTVARAPLIESGCEEQTGRVITQETRKNEKRAGYGEQMLARLATSLTEEYGAEYSRPHLQDMRRVFECFDICQTASGKFGSASGPAVRTEKFQTSSGECEGRV
jgi:hypothetical protein